MDEVSLHSCPDQCGNFHPSSSLQRPHLVVSYASPGLKANNAHKFSVFIWDTQKKKMTVLMS